MGLKAWFWASRLGFGLQGWVLEEFGRIRQNMDLEARRGGQMEKEKKEKFLQYPLPLSECMCGCEVVRGASAPKGPVTYA